MKAFKVIAGVIVATATVVAINASSAGATANNKCDVKGTKLGEWGSTFKEEGNKITSTFEVTGSNCTTPVTLAVWESPADSVDTIKDDIYGQTLFSHVTKTFGPGTHSLTTDLPNCFYQADLLASANPKAPDGTAHYAFQNGQILKVHPLRDHKFGGNKKCEEPKDECPNIAGDQGEVPEGHEVDGKGNCVVPEEPETGGRGGATQGVQTLPKTGASAAVVFTGVTTVAGAAHAAIRKLLRK